MGTRITGIIKDSVSPIDGILLVKLAAPLVDETSNALHFPIEKRVEIKAGAFNLELPPTNRSDISYEFKILNIEVEYYYQTFIGVDFYGVVCQVGDKWYSGAFYDAAQSVQLVQLQRKNENLLYAFHASIPDVEKVSINDLIPCGITTDRLASGVRQLAKLITTDSAYLEALGRALLQFKGDFDAATYYSGRVAVQYGGASWINVWPTLHAGNVPFKGSSYWQLFADKGDAGGTGGDNTPYDPVGWKRDSNAPSKAVLTDVLETKASKADLALLAPLVDANLQGMPLCPTAPRGTKSKQAANTEFVANALASSGVLYPGQITLAVDRVAPPGWRPCNGDTLNPVTYKDLFNAIGTEFGGNGVDGFRLPTFAAPFAGSQYLIFTNVF